MRVSVFNRALGNLGGRPVGDLVRRPSRPWHWTIAFHRPTDEVATFKAQATSMLLLPARRSRPAATRRASCSALVPSVRPMHTHTNRPVNQFTTSATVNNKPREAVVHVRRFSPFGLFGLLDQEVEARLVVTSKELMVRHDSVSLESVAEPSLVGDELPQGCSDLVVARLERIATGLLRFHLYGVKSSRRASDVRFTAWSSCNAPSQCGIAKHASTGPNSGTISAVRPASIAVVRHATTST